MRGFAFAPARLEIAAGDTVIWINRDVVPHTATVEGSWDSGSIAGSARWQVVPSQQGSTEYTCTFHPTMRGTIVVR